MHAFLAGAHWNAQQTTGFIITTLTCNTNCIETKPKAIYVGNTRQYKLVI